MGGKKPKGHPAYSDPRYRAARLELRKWDHICHAPDCRQPIDMQLKYPHPLSWSADHIVPKSMLQPGDVRLWHISNLQAMHLTHNQSRGNKTMPKTRPLDW